MVSCPSSLSAISSPAGTSPSSRRRATVSQGIFVSHQMTAWAIHIPEPRLGRTTCLGLKTAASFCDPDHLFPLGGNKGPYPRGPRRLWGRSHPARLSKSKMTNDRSMQTVTLSAGFRTTTNCHGNNNKVLRIYSRMRWAQVSLFPNGGSDLTGKIREVP